jgi:hypothetical protein
MFRNKQIGLLGEMHEGKPEVISTLVPFVEEWRMFPLKGGHNDALDAVEKAIEPFATHSVELAMSGVDMENNRWIPWTETKEEEATSSFSYGEASITIGESATWLKRQRVSLLR